MVAKNGCLVVCGHFCFFLSLLKGAPANNSILNLCIWTSARQGRLFGATISVFVFVGPLVHGKVRYGFISISERLIEQSMFKRGGKKEGWLRA